MSKNVGFVSFRFAGTDGVTLESLKWVEAFRRMGYQSFFCAGEVSMPKNVSMEFAEMHFSHPEIEEMTKRCFSSQSRTNTLTAELHNMRRTIKKQLYTFINHFQIDLLIMQNVLAIPMNIPFSMALVEVLAETRIPTIAHHHDFYWERDRYRINCVQDILRGCFPANLANITHVVINEPAQAMLAFRNGISSNVVPNVMDYANPPLGKDDYNKDFKAAIGIEDDTLLVLQPTRIVQRKGIENTIELVRRLDRKASIIISHESGDEGGEYKQRVLEYAELLNVDLKLIADTVSEVRGQTKDGKKVYDLNDVYAHADLVSYPSILEGFGNALLETYYFKKPLVVNTYPVYITDIKPKGFLGLEFTNFISKQNVREILDLLGNSKGIEHMVETNYRLANQYFSYELLEKKLKALARIFFGV